jgi:hypothetical protein
MALAHRMTTAVTSVAVAGTHATVRFDEGAAVDSMGVAVTRALTRAGGLTSLRRVAPEVRRACADAPLVRMAVWKRRVGRS